MSTLKVVGIAVACGLGASALYFHLIGPAVAKAMEPKAV